MKRLRGWLTAFVGEGQGAPSWTGYACRHVKNGHVCRRDTADTHRIHSCQCGLIAWAT